MIIIFCGIPGSGKTTIAKRLSLYLRKYGRPKLFISDKLRPPVYKKFFRLLQENLNRYDFLIFDATFYKKAWRRKMAMLAGSEKVMTIYLHCPLSLAIQRNKKRRATIPEKAIRIIARRFEEPERSILEIDTAKKSVASSVGKILNYILKHVQQ